MTSLSPGGATTKTVALAGATGLVARAILEELLADASGEFRVSVGGKQPGFKGKADAATTSFVEGLFTVVGAPAELKR